jgi:hypothetical protein
VKTCCVTGSTKALLVKHPAARNRVQNESPASEGSLTLDLACNVRWMDGSDIRGGRHARRPAVSSSA